jgi:ATP-dependent Lon protease
MEARRRVREHILRIDDTFARHDFAYRSLVDGTALTVLTPEEVQYPTFAAPKGKTAEAGAGEAERAKETSSQMSLPESAPGASADPTLPDSVHPGHIIVPENTKGWSYRRLFANHLKGARRITVNDPYVRAFFQARNVMELLQMVHEIVAEGDEVAVELVTQPDREAPSRQEENLNQMVSAFAGSRVTFSWKFDLSPNFHARSITTDTGWKITIDRGLDIFQRFETGPFSLEQAVQEARLTRGAEVTYLQL